MIEVQLNENTYVFLKLEYGKPNQDQEPLLDREPYYKLMNLDGEEMNENKTGGYRKNRPVILHNIFAIPILGVAV